MNYLRGLPLDLFFVHFGLALKTHYILKKFGKVRKLSGWPKGREEKSNVRDKEKKEKEKSNARDREKKKEKMFERERRLQPPLPSARD